MRIMTEDQQNEEYTKSARIARSVSVGNMQCFVDQIHSEQEQKKRRRKKKKKKSKTKIHKFRSRSTKNTPTSREKNRKFNQFKFSQNMPPKILQGAEDDISSDSE